MQQINDTIQYGNLVIQVINGDITKLKDYDALVTPANPYLMQEPGISGQIFKACGREKLTNACQKIINGLDNQQERKISSTTVVVTKSYELKEKQNINNLIMAVEPSDLSEEFQETKFVQTISNCLQKSLELKYQKIALPILCNHDDHFEPKFWAILYKRAMLRFSEANKYQLHITIVCTDEDTYYNFKKAFHQQEFVVVTDKYITDITDTDLMINVVNQHDPKQGACGKILEAAGYIMGQEVMSKAKVGKKWIVTDSYELKSNRINQILHYIGPINKKMNRTDKLAYFFNKIFVELKCQSICIPLVALPQALFFKTEINGFLMNRLSNSLKDAIEFFETQHKCGIIRISIQNNSWRTYCQDLFS